MKNNLKNGDMIIVEHAGEEKRGKFIKYKSDGTSMQLHISGALRWYPTETFNRMAEALTIEQMVANKEKKNEKKNQKKEEEAPIKKVEAKQPKKKPAKAEKRPEKRPVKQKIAEAKVKVAKPEPGKAKKLKVGKDGEVKVSLPARTANLLREGKMTVEEIAKLIGKKPAYVYNIRTFMRNPEHWNFKH
jgi:outer membrane biosynthesis protein TonB